MAEPPAHRPQDGALVVTLYGKMADLIRAEAARRQMGHDQVLRDIVWCWYIDLEVSRHRLGPPRHVRD